MWLWVFICSYHKEMLHTVMYVLIELYLFVHWLCYAWFIDNMYCYSEIPLVVEFTSWDSSMHPTKLYPSHKLREITSMVYCPLLTLWGQRVIIMALGHYKNYIHMYMGLHINQPGTKTIQLYMKLPINPYKICLTTTKESRSTSADIVL